MENLDEISKVSGSRESSIKDLNGSRGSIKSTKSLERASNALSNSSGSVHFAKSSSIKSRASDTDNQHQKQLDASLKVPHKIISNWRQACDRTRDRTRDLLKRWRTLPEFEAGENGAGKKNGHKDVQAESGWSVHVWSKSLLEKLLFCLSILFLATWVDRFSVDTSEPWDEDDGYQLTSTQNSKFGHFFTHLLDHDHDDLISEQDFEALIEVTGISRSRCHVAYQKC